MGQGAYGGRRGRVRGLGLAATAWAQGGPLLSRPGAGLQNGRGLPAGRESEGGSRLEGWSWSKKTEGPDDRKKNGKGGCEARLLKATVVKTATNKDLCLCSSPDSVSFVLQHSFLHPSVRLFLHHFQGQLPRGCYARFWGKFLKSFLACHVGMLTCNPFIYLFNPSNF